MFLKGNNTKKWKFLKHLVFNLLFIKNHFYHFIPTQTCHFRYFSCLFHSFSQHFKISKRLDPRTSLASRNFKITLARWCKKSQKVNKTHVGCFYSYLRFIIRMIIIYLHHFYIYLLWTWLVAVLLVVLTDLQTKKFVFTKYQLLKQIQFFTRNAFIIRRDGELPKHKSFYICSDHFEKECFKRSIFVKLFLSCWSFLEIANVNNHKYS